MAAQPTHVLGAVLIGLGATLAIDLWGLVLKRGFGIVSLNYCLLGRWLLHMPEGTLVHPNIAAARPKTHECPVGWCAHYLIGVALGLGFVLIASADWLERPALLPALAFGVITVAMPWLVMQPSFGLGFAASRAPKPGQARLKSLMTHAVFGIGLYLWGLLLSPLLFR